MNTLSQNAVPAYSPQPEPVKPIGFFQPHPPQCPNGGGTANERHTTPERYDLTIGFLTVGDAEATQASETILRGLTEIELMTKLAELGVILPVQGTQRGRITLRGGAQLAWERTAADATGETR